MRIAAPETSRGNSTHRRGDHHHLFSFVRCVDLVLIVICSVRGVFGDDYAFQRKSSKCVPITIDICSEDLAYNTTIFPNLLKHNTQEEAQEEINPFHALAKVKCSPDIKIFLCSLFAPVCTVLEEPIPPCRHLCLSAKSGCEGLMRKFGYSWPEIFNCDKFVDDAMCVGENRTRLAMQEATAESLPPEATDGDSSASRRHPELECPHIMKVYLRAPFRQCSLPCQGDGVVPTLLSTQMRHYLRLWTGAWAVFCFICTLFTAASFVISAERSEFPDRAILYMSLCYLAVSLIYVIGLVAEDTISCGGMSATKSPLVAQGIDSFACTALAAAHYYFSTAGLIWWLVLCFSWFLVTTLKWGEAPVSNVFSSYFNTLAWFLPATLVIAVLVTGSVDGDLLTGVCSVGNLQPSALLNFIVIPQAILISLGSILFTCAFVSIARIRSYIKVQQRMEAKWESNEAAADKMGRLMLRISSFSLIYIIPVIVGELATYYQAANMEDWLTSWYSTRCLHAQRGAFGFTQSRELCPLTDHRGSSMVNRAPEPFVLFARYFSYFGIGVACAVWTANGKTLSAFGDFFHQGRARVPTRIS